MRKLIDLDEVTFFMSGNGVQASKNGRVIVAENITQLAKKII